MIPLRKCQTINFSINSISAVINAHPPIEVINIPDNLLFVIVIPPPYEVMNYNDHERK